MFEFISANKSWLFDGAGLALVVGVVTFIYRKFSKPKEASHITVHVAPSPAAIEQTVQTTTATRIAPLTFEQVVAEFRDAPPLQIEAINERFKGVSIRWETRIFNIEKSANDTVRLSLHFGPGTPGLIICYVALADYKELAYLKKETPVTVIGEIERATDSTVSLTNAQLLL
ncbi:hypothetical protein [Stenotrophomonas sp. Leaf70]|uniref:hypothetical protein n=2 Tax=Stenotrophomonas TaxID=40323 RepID=UPI000AFD9CA0|nr:hypothetical protein [Stenotrophomonas sp. Leaf70]